MQQNRKHNSRNDGEAPEFPFSYLQSAQQMLSEKGGASKLRARNDMIHGDMIDLARRYGYKLESSKQGDRLWMIMPNMGITVALVAA